MAQAINDLYAGGFPHFNDLAFATNNKPGRAALEQRCPVDALERLHELETLKNEAIQLSLEFIRLTGLPNPECQMIALQCNQDFQDFQESLFLQYPDLQAPVSRSNFDVSAPGRINEKIRVPTMVVSAAMRMLIDPRSGYFDTVEDLNGNIDDRFITEFSRNGGIPVIPLDVSINDAIALLRSIKESHLVYRKPVFIHPHTSIGKARSLLMGQVADAALYVVDEKMQLLRMISRSDVELEDRFDQEKRELHDNNPIRTLFEMDSAQVFKKANEGITPQDAKKQMSDQNVHQLPIFDTEGRVKHMLTETHAALSDELQPFIADRSLGAMFTVGIGPFNDMAERIDALMEAGAVGFFIETAHAFRRDVIVKSSEALKQVRKRYPNAVIGFGTVTEPEAVEVLSSLGIDIVKIGVGGGGHCSTFDVTGVGGLPYRAFRECSMRAAALGNIQVMTDGGINSTRRFNIAASDNGTALVQVGTWLASTVQSSSQAEFLNGSWKKLAFGEASDHAEDRRRKERRLEDKLQDVLERMTKRFHNDKILGIHSEGKVTHRTIPSGPDSHVGGIILKIKKSLQSWGTYADAGNMQEAQERSRIMRVTNTPT